MCPGCSNMHALCALPAEWEYDPSAFESRVDTSLSVCDNGSDKLQSIRGLMHEIDCLGLMHEICSAFYCLGAYHCLKCV